MNKIKVTFILIVVGVLFSFIQEEKFKEVKNPEALLSKLKELASKTTTIQASFKEEKHLAFMDEPQEASGKMFYKKEDKMKWVQEKPFEYIILINGEVLKIKDNGKEKSFDESSKVASRINKFMMGLIQGDYQENKAYDSRFLESNSQYLIELTPKVKSLQKIYEKLELYFDKKDNRLQGIEFFETGGDLRSVKFYDQVYNGKIDDQVFLNL